MRGLLRHILPDWNRSIKPDSLLPLFLFEYFQFDCRFKKKIIFPLFSLHALRLDLAEEKRRVNHVAPFASNFIAEHARASDSRLDRVPSALKLMHADRRVTAYNTPCASCSRWIRKRAKPCGWLYPRAWQSNNRVSRRNKSVSGESSPPVYLRLIRSRTDSIDTPAS